MKQKSLKQIEKNLVRKKAELQTAIEASQQLEIKIQELKYAIENLQAAKLENIFQHVQKEALKEELDITTDTIPNILQTIRNCQPVKDETKAEHLGDNERTSEDMANEQHMTAVKHLSQTAESTCQPLPSPEKIFATRQ